MSTHVAEVPEAPVRPARFDRVIVTLDGSPTAERALPVAAALARQGDVPMTLLIASCSGRDADDRTYLEAVAATVSGADADIRVETGPPPSAAVLLARLAHDPMALVVMATHARRALTELMLGSVAEEVVRRSPVPVVLVGPHGVVPAPDDRYATLLVCVGHQATATQLAPFAAGFALTCGVQPIVLEVDEPSPRPTQVRDAHEASAAHHLVERLRASDVPATYSIKYDVLPDRAVIAYAAAVDRPLVLLAGRGRAATERFSSTSTTVAVARAASCPVIVVGPNARRQV
jgi:nucleotide-binding universal stress UspA family protein